METSIDNRVKVLDGKKIERLRIARGLSVEQLAKNAGLSEKTLGNARNGKPVLFSTIKLLADALGVTYSELLPESEAVDAASPRQFRVQIVIQADMSEVKSSPYLQELVNLFMKMLPAGDIQIADVKEGSIIVTLVMSEEALQRLAVIFPDFHEHARSAVRDLPDGLAYFSGTLADGEQAERIRRLLELIEGVTELRIQASPDDEDDTSVSSTPPPSEPAPIESLTANKIADLRFTICRRLSEYISLGEMSVDLKKTPAEQAVVWAKIRADLDELNRLEKNLPSSFGDDESAI